MAVFCFVWHSIGSNEEFIVEVDDSLDRDVAAPSPEPRERNENENEHPDGNDANDSYRLYVTDLPVVSFICSFVVSFEIFLNK